MEFEINNHIGKCRLNSNSLNNSDGFSPEDQSISSISHTDAMYHKSMDITDIKNSFMEVYRMRMSEVECSTVLNKEEQNEKMLHILKAYIGQLEEQNDVLMSTVIELEKETQQRVKQMEKRLKSTAKSTMEAVINLHECEELIRSLVTQRLHIESVLYNVQKQVSLLKVENNFLRDQNFNLNHDIQALLHIIHRARSTGNWEMDCMMFCEVTPEQVFGPIQSMSPMYCDSSCLSHLKESNTKKLSDLNALSTSGSDLTEFRNHHCVEAWNHKDQSLKIKPVDQHNEHVIGRTDGIHVAPQQTLVYYNDCVKPRGGSLPSLDNIVLCNNTLQRSCSSKVDGICEKPDCSLSRLEYLNHVKRKDNGSQRKRKEKQSLKQSVHKSESNLYFRQAYSEPLLFMYGDGVYVYKPCEAVQKNNCVPPAENLINSLPYQSIDLTLPVEEVNDHDLSACDWDHAHRLQKLSICADSFSLPYDKDKVLNCCCSSVDFEEMHSSKDFSPSDIHILTKVQDVCSTYDPDKCTNMSETSSKYNRCTECHRSNDYNSSFESKRNDETKYVSVSQYSQTYQVSSHLSIGTQTVANDENSNCLVQGSENNCAGDVTEIQKSVKLLKQNLLKAEDTVHAKEILIEQLQNHLQTAFKEIEMKDKALENVEKKLDMSRKEKASLENKISNLEEETEKLSTALKEAKALSDSILSEVESKNEEMKELHQQEQVLQNQKRTLMIQLDTRFDELDAAKTEILEVKDELKHCKTQIAQQTHIIQNLQEALVKSKRALDEYVIKSPSQTPNRTSHSSNSIVNI